MDYKELKSNINTEHDPLLSDVLRYLGYKNISIELDRNILWINKTILWDLREDSLSKQKENTIYNLNLL